MPPLYKYIADPGALPFLLRGTVKFTPIPELNDPSELIPNMIMAEVRASLDRLREDGYTDDDMPHLHRQEHLLSRLAPEFRAIDVPATKELATAVVRCPSYDLLPVLEQMLIDTASVMSSKVGLFCLSRRADSLPMWAHYAGNARGLVIEFRDLDTVFCGDDTGILYEPIAIKYERERRGVTFDPRSHESLFFAKFQDWSYEEEVRVVLPLEDCHQQLAGGNILHLYDVPPTCVARVILGWNMAPSDIEAVRTHIRDINPGVGVMQARCIRGPIELEPTGH